jgi:hypothetical protein
VNESAGRLAIWSIRLVELKATMLREDAIMFDRAVRFSSLNGRKRKHCMKLQ